MSKSRDAVEDIRTIDTVTATANAALPKAGGALTGTVTNFTSTGIDDNATSTAVTIDASENVLVGKTTTALATVGLALGGAGFVGMTRDGYEPLSLNRLTSDGAIANFYKDSTVVGSIGTYLNASYMMGSGNKGIFLNGTLNPAGASGGIDDNTQNIGASNRRWKDLYLSGGVYLGGTGAANKLQDYETGTWTPTWQGASGQSGQSYSTREASYTKIGRAVHIQAYMNISDRGNFTNGAKVAGLPFTVSPSNQAAVTFGYHSGFNLNSGNSLQGWVYSGDFFYLYQGNGSTDSIALVQSATDSGPTFHFSFTYFTNQ